MNKYFEEARQVLIELDATIARKKELRERLCTRLPFGEQCSEDQWNQLNGRCWIYGTPHPEEYLEQRMAAPAVLPKMNYAESDALSVIAQWTDFLERMEITLNFQIKLYRVQKTKNDCGSILAALKKCLL